MKNLHILPERQWKSHCIREVNGARRLKRKSREPGRHANGLKAFRVEMSVDEEVVGAAQERPAGVAPGAQIMDAGSGASPDALDLRNGAFVTAAGVTGRGSSQTKRGLVKVGGAEGLEAQPRLVVCQRPPDASYLAVSQVPYSASPDPCASPRSRLGETAGVSTEIKAIQQTRRLLANARERTRVHTISAAFEALRKQVPCYSYGQKLSKLAILRIACNYILSLARLADLDYSADHSNLSFSECVEQCTRTLQSEGRSKKRKE
ncbi:transcription factor ATOH8 [Spea bombifrons]|uniref:transcription factor ATOH8 n=1 Tax=Spea bombifrons TaxID=233779 RepID=UPI00234AA8E1|nr:transcription factor ATOH8 [Spea bombifrons]